MQSPDFARDDLDTIMTCFLKVANNAIATNLRISEDFLSRMDSVVIKINKTINDNKIAWLYLLMKWLLNCQLKKKNRLQHLLKLMTEYIDSQNNDK